jgi:hypothetical protein
MSDRWIEDGWLYGHLIRRLCHAHPLPAESPSDLLKYCSLVRIRRQC